MYILSWQLAQVRLDQARLAEPLASVRHRQGKLLGHMEAWLQPSPGSGFADRDRRRAQEQ